MTPKRRKQPPQHQVVYWDTCLYIAWLTKETNHPKPDLDGLFDTVRNVGRRLSKLVVSQMVVQELLLDSQAVEVRDAFRRLLGMPNVLLVDFERPIMLAVEEIRSYYRIRKNSGMFPFVPSFTDTIHLATAINRNVDAFYTFDKGGKDKGNLLLLDGDVAGHPLKICTPPAGQLTLFQRQ